MPFDGCISAGQDHVNIKKEKMEKNCIVLLQIQIRWGWLIGLYIFVQCSL